MIQSRQKLKLALWLLLIVRNGAFASLKCISGIKVDGTNGYNDNHKPESVLCGTGETCLRVEVDEVLLRSENKSQLICF